MVPFTPVISEKNIELNYEKQKDAEDNAHTTDTEWDENRHMTT